MINQILVNQILGYLALIFGGIAIGYLLSELINSEKFRKLKRIKKENDKTRKKLFC